MAPTLKTPEALRTTNVPTAKTGRITAQATPSSDCLYLAVKSRTKRRQISSLAAIRFRAISIQTPGIQGPGSGLVGVRSPSVQNDSQSYVPRVVVSRRGRGLAAGGWKCKSGIRTLSIGTALIRTTNLPDCIATSPNRSVGAGLNQERPKPHTSLLDIKELHQFCGRDLDFRMRDKRFF